MNMNTSAEKKTRLLLIDCKPCADGSYTHTMYEGRDKKFFASFSAMLTNPIHAEQMRTAPEMFIELVSRGEIE